MKQLPKDFTIFTDAYFLRALEILKKQRLNPYIHAQIFIRQGPGEIYGLDEARALLAKFGENRINVYSFKEGARYKPNETIMVLEGRAQDIIPLETIILGVISAETTIKNDGNTIDLLAITDRVKQIKQLIGERSLMYFGARHWRYDLDAVISHAAFAGGATDASTDAGAATANKKGVGTIPHSLECIFAWKYGLENAVSESTKVFDTIINPNIPRIALVDFANHEVDDSLRVAKELGSKLYGIRIDTCGENMMQGTDFPGHSERELVDPRRGEESLMNMSDSTYWFGKGVTISGVYVVRKALDAKGFPNVKIILSSGFGEIDKVKAFVYAEKELKCRLFDALGIGNIFHSRAATMDIVGVGKNLNNLQPIAKIGRTYQPNRKLKS